MKRAEGDTATVSRDDHNNDANRSASEPEWAAENIEVRDSCVVHFAVYGLRCSA